MCFFQASSSLSSCQTIKKIAEVYFHAYQPFPDEKIEISRGYTMSGLLYLVVYLGFEPTVCNSRAYNLNRYVKRWDLSYEVYTFVSEF